MRRTPISFRQLCAMAKAILEAEPSMPDSEWKARILDTLIRWGFAYPDPLGLVNDAMTRVERARRQPRPAPQARTRVPAGMGEAIAQRDPPWHARRQETTSWTGVSDLIQALQANRPH